MTDLDPSSWKKALESLRPRLAFDAQNPDEARAWQGELRARFAQRLGTWPQEHVALEPQVGEAVRCEGYTRQKVSFWSQAGLRVWGYLLVPDGFDGPRPGTLCLHGHGPGVGPIVGLDENAAPLAEPEYHQAFAVGCARQGYVTLAIELLGFGRRVAGGESSGWGCQTLAGTALMLGQTLALWRVYDAMRALDFLQTCPEVDASRLGALGISGGGLTALFLAALDERVRATVVSGYLNSFRASVMSVPHCIDNFVPGLLLDAEMSDLAGLVAPRALWCENGTRDSIFPVAAFIEALARTRHIYEVLEARDQCDGETFDGEHQFFGTGAWPFLRRHLAASAP